MTASTLTPVLTNEARIAQTVAAYVAAKPAARRSLIAAINVKLADGLTAMTSLLAAGDIEAAQAVAAKGGLLADMVIACNATDGPAAKPAAVAVDPRSVIAQRVADLRLAADLLEQGFVSPSGLDDAPAMSSDVFGVITYAAGDMVSAVSIGSAKITRSTFSNAIQDVVQAAFDANPDATFLASTRIGHEGGHTRGGYASGAINARLYPLNGSACTLIGFGPSTDPSLPQGAVRL